MDDEDLMTFGKHKGERMADVPASYLLWLHDQHCNDKNVMSYIEDNLAALYKECPDYIHE